MDHQPTDEADDGAPVEELAREAAQHNRDRTTKREALELELEDEGRSDEGEHVGDHIA